MITYRVRQGSEDWHALRMGKPTASVFNQILMPKKLELSASARPLVYKLAAERLGYVLPDFTSAAMEAGRENEPKARAWYEMAHDCEVEQVGFCTPEHGRWGVSPDGLVGADGLVEFKCPGPVAQIRYLIEEGGAYADYSLQIQGQIWVCEREWCDSVSWSFEGLATAKYRHYRDEKIIAALELALPQFCDILDATEAKLIAMGCKRTMPPPAVEIEDGLGVSDADVAAIWAGRMNQ